MTFWRTVLGLIFQAVCVCVWLICVLLSPDDWHSRCQHFYCSGVGEQYLHTFVLHSSDIFCSYNSCEYTVCVRYNEVWCDIIRAVDVNGGWAWGWSCLHVDNAIYCMLLYTIAPKIVYISIMFIIPYIWNDSVHIITHMCTHSLPHFLKQGRVSTLSVALLFGALSSY